MKRLTSVVTLITLMASAGGEIYFSMDNLCPKTAVVTCVDYAEDVVYCMDCNKNIWSFTECEDWSEGDVVSMIMDTKGTASIYDDKIVIARFAGTYEALSPYGNEPEEDEDELFKEYLEAVSNGKYVEYR